MTFRDVSEQIGLTTIPHSFSERRYIVETMGGGGVALFDCDNDGWPDLNVTNDGNPNCLYYNNGNGTFS
jgi:hypothetical protein